MYAIDQMDDEKAKANDEIDLNDFAQLDKLVGRADKADYLSELVGRERSLRLQIEDMSRSRYYLSAVNQRKVCAHSLALAMPQLSQMLHDHHGNAWALVDWCLLQVTREIRQLSRQMAEVHRDILVVKGGPDKTMLKQAHTISEHISEQTVSPPPQSPVRKDSMPVVPFLRAVTGHSLRKVLSSSPISVKVKLDVQPRFDFPRARAAVLATLNDQHADSGSLHSVQLAMAKQSPQGYEAAVRSALLKTEMWKMSAAESIRRGKDLRIDLDRIAMQNTLAERAISRLERLDLDHMEPTATMNRAEIDAQIKRLGQLRRYSDMLEAAQAEMLIEGKEVVKVGLKKAVAHKRKRDEEARVERCRNHAATNIQV